MGLEGADVGGRQCLIKDRFLPAEVLKNMDLSVRLNRLQLKNPILVASGTFGYAREMSAFVEFEKLGGIIPKTVTPAPRPGNPPPRTVETASGMLNSIGLDNDGFDQFVAEKLPWLLTLGTSIIVNIAGKCMDDFPRMAEVLDGIPGIAAIELNISLSNALRLSSRVNRTSAIPSVTVNKMRSGFVPGTFMYAISVDVKTRLYSLI